MNTIQLLNEARHDNARLREEKKQMIETMLQENAENEKQFFERKARDVQRLKWVTEKEKELTLLNYPYGSHSSELKLIREVKSLLLLEKEAKT